MRACSFFKGGILYHDTAACLGEERGPEASHAQGSFPWCCPKCFKKGATALGKSLVPPAEGRGTKRGR